jgi:hypothetical protein
VYRVDELGDGVSFDPGTSLLLTGSSTETDTRLLDAVAPRDDERCIVITTNMGADQVADELHDRGVDREKIGIIDCTSTDTTVEDVDVRQLNSPGDLTGISLEFAKLVEEWGDSVPTRVGFASVSTALMYAETRTMFRFLHVFTARIRSAEMLGVFALDPEMHEDQAYNTIRAVFTCEAETGEGETALRGSGFRMES